MIGAASIMDEQMVKVTPKSSTRVGSVWSERGRQEPLSTRTSPEAASGAHASVFSPGRASKHEEFKAKRQEAARWVQAMTGVPLPTATDHDFREHLRDGVLLCRVLNVVCPGAVKIMEGTVGPGTGESIQRYENIQNFIREADRLGVPSECQFSVADLDSDGWEDRPRVADCILWLKRLHEGSNQPLPLSPLSGLPYLSGGNDIMANVDSPRKAAQIAASRAVQKLPGSPGGYSMVASSTPPMGSTLQAAQNRCSSTSTAVTKLMQQCTVMLRERMTAHSMDVTHHSVQTTTHITQRTNASEHMTFDTVGPALESVLAGLTQEYERRLLAKDQEINSTKERMNQVSRQMQELQEQLFQLREELGASQQYAAKQASAVVSAQAEELQQQVEQLQTELHEREARLDQMQEELHSQNSLQGQRAQELEDELNSMREQLDHAAQLQANYRSIQEENKKLYNLVQDLKGSIRVFCRVRPLGRTGDPSASCVDVGNENELAVYDEKGNQKIYRFDRVFTQNITQAEVYADTQPLIRSVLDGYNVCIFAYGQTGSGKTHTMSGTNVENMDGRGINYRALDDLFSLRDARSSEVEYTIKTQMLEIYNETLRDLLIEDQQSQNRLDILNTQASGCNVPGAVQEEVYNAEDVLSMMAKGMRNRRQAETRMNERSSRSHQILTIIVDGLNQVTGARTHGCLHLVDLAGSERVKQSEATGERLTEAQHINKSLSALGDVMAALANKDKHVPFRNSKLTQLLADSLSGQAKVMMFMHIAPEMSSCSESSSTLKFATRVSEITLGQAKKNVESGEVFKAHEEITKLKQVAERKDRAIWELRSQLDKEKEEKDSMARQLEQLKAQLAEARRSSTSMTPAMYDPSGGNMSVESHRTMSRIDHGGFVSPAPRSVAPSPAPYQGTPMHTITEDASPMPDVTPKSSRLTTTFGASKIQQRPASRATSASESRPSTAQSQGAPPSGSLTARASSRPSMDAPSSSRPALSARAGGTYGAPRTSQPPSTTSAHSMAPPPSSARTAGTYGITPRGPAAARTTVPVVAAATKEPVISTGGASASSRRLSTWSGGSSKRWN